MGACDLSAIAADARLSSRDNKPHGHVSKFARYDLAAGGEFMRRSGMGVMLEPWEVNYSTSGKAGARLATPDEGIRTIVTNENHPGQFDNDTRELSGGRIL